MLYSFLVMLKMIGLIVARSTNNVIGKKDKPIIVSHHMLMGLIEGAEKMSKSILVTFGRIDRFDIQCLQSSW